MQGSLLRSRRQIHRSFAREQRTSWASPRLPMTIECALSWDVRVPHRNVITRCRVLRLDPIVGGAPFDLLDARRKQSPIIAGPPHRKLIRAGLYAP